MNVAGRELRHLTFKALIVKISNLMPNKVTKKCLLLLAGNTIHNLFLRLTSSDSKAVRRAPVCHFDGDAHVRMADCRPKVGSTCAGCMERDLSRSG